MTISRTKRYRNAMVRFTLEPAGKANLVRGYSDSGLWIGAQHVTHSCIVTAGELITDWPPATFGELEPAHLERIFALSPEVVVIATGPQQQFASPEVRGAFAVRRIGLEVMHLGAACRTFNVLVQEERPVAAALFVR
jgi:uncharacterized protein